MPPPSRTEYTPNPHKLSSSTTTGDAYQAIPLPRGVQAEGTIAEWLSLLTLVQADPYQSR